MFGRTERSASEVAGFTGWFVLAAGISRVPILLVPILSGSMVGTSGLLLATAPLILLQIVAGLALILRFFWSYYLVYAAGIMGGWMGWWLIAVPYLSRFLRFGPSIDDILLAASVASVLLLTAEHINRLRHTQLQNQVLHRTVILCLATLAVLSLGAGRMLIVRGSGATKIADVPIVGRTIAAVAPASEVRYSFNYSKLQRSGTFVVSGVSSEAAIKQFAESSGLKEMADRNGRSRMFKVARDWNLSADQFPVEFGPDDLYYIGRFGPESRAVLQLGFRKRDGRFTAEVMGKVD